MRYKLMHQRLREAQEHGDPQLIFATEALWFTNHSLHAMSPFCPKGRFNQTVVRDPENEGG